MYSHQNNRSNASKIINDEITRLIDTRNEYKSALEFIRVACGLIFSHKNIHRERLMWIQNNPSEAIGNGECTMLDLYRNYKYFSPYFNRYKFHYIETQQVHHSEDNITEDEKRKHPGYQKKVLHRSYTIDSILMLNIESYNQNNITDLYNNYEQKIINAFQEQKDFMITKTLEDRSINDPHIDRVLNHRYWYDFLSDVDTFKEIMVKVFEFTLVPASPENFEICHNKKCNSLHINSFEFKGRDLITELTDIVSPKLVSENRKIMITLFNSENTMNYEENRFHFRIYVYYYDF